jgi:actin-related protein 3
MSEPGKYRFCDQIKCEKDQPGLTSGKNDSLHKILGFRYTKLGYAANKDPQFIFPSAIAIKESARVGDQNARRVTKGVEDLDFFIGDEAFDASGYAVKVSVLIYYASDYTFLSQFFQYPVRHGIVEDWDLMERFLEQCIFKYLRAEPGDHHFLLPVGHRGPSKNAH